MASSPAESRLVASTPTGFALQQLTTCWDQAYEALVRGDLEQVEALLDVANDFLAAAGDWGRDTREEALLRSDAHAAHGRLQGGMRAGLLGVQEELARTRTGARAMRGYGYPGLRVGDQVTRDV